MSGVWVKQGIYIQVIPYEPLCLLVTVSFVMPSSGGDSSITSIEWAPVDTLIIVKTVMWIDG
jgi:hypothetical protein